MKLAYGLDEENLDASGEFETYEQAFEEALTECDPEVGQTVYVCEVHPYKWSVCATQLVEQMTEDAYSECGEHVDVWPDYDKDELKILQENLDVVVGDWLRHIKQDKPRFWTCGKSQNFVVTQEHIDKVSK